MIVLFQQTLLLCLCVSSTNLCELTPTLGLGHIQSYMGKVTFITHTVSVQIDHADTIQIPNVLLELGQQITLIVIQLKAIQNITNDRELKVIPELLNVLNITSNKIKITLAFFPDKRLNNRVERGLLNIVGIGLNYLFGIASSEDIDKINKRFITIEELENNQNLLLDKLTAQSNSQFNKTLRKFVG